MTRRSCLIGILGVCAATLSAQAQPSVFRSDADAVTVNVSVKRGNNPALGLAAADFRLFDNDVLQEVSAVSVDAVPIDVTFVIDPGAFAGFDTTTSFLDSVETARESVRGMAALLRPSDRFRVLTAGNAVVNAIPWQPAGVPDTSAIQLVPSGEVALVADSVFMALFHRTDPDRRHLVVALTAGADSCSLVSGQSLAKGAERSGAVLHWITVERKTLRLSPDLSPTVSGPRIVVSGVTGLPLGAHAWCRATYKGGFDARPFLSDAVTATGGTKQSAWWSVERVAVEAFEEIFSDYRSSYLLHYAPRGVERTGWHRLRVEMSTKGLTVRARTGYWGTAAASGAPPIPASPSR